VNLKREDKIQVEISGKIQRKSNAKWKLDANLQFPFANYKLILHNAYLQEEPHTF